MPDPKYYKARLEQLKGDRSNFDVLFEEVKHYVWPDGADIIEKTSPGEKKTQRLFDSTPLSALDKFESAMLSWLIPRHLRWHGLRASDDSLMRDPSVREFFEQVTKLLFRIRENPKARFYGQMGENMRSLGAYGNGCIFLDGAPEGKGLRYRHVSIGKTWIETDYNGVVDTIYHEYELTAKAASQKWPHAVPERARQRLEADKPFEKNTYLHVVHPNENHDPDSVETDKMAFLAYDIACDEDAFIPNEQGKMASGFHENPYIWSRFTKNPDEMYGRGPAMLALPDMETLQSMEKTFLRSGHKVADPPLLVAHDGRLGRGQRKIRLTPGGLNYGGVDEAGRPKIVPLQTGARLDITLEMKERKIDQIFDLFFVKLFDILERDRVEMTATEVIERSREKGQLIAPVVGRQQTELLHPMIEREIGILTRQGLLPDLPEALVEANGEYEIEYDTLATRFQQADEISAYQRLLAVFQPQAELDPAILQVLKAEDAMRAFGEDSGIRAALFRSSDEMDAIRAEQAEAAQQQAMAEQAPQLAGAAKTISEIEGGAGESGGAGV